MGNVPPAIKKAVECIRECQNEPISFFESQEQSLHSPQLSSKCLEHVIDMNSSSFDSLKRIHRYLHPALQELNTLCDSGDPEGFLRVNQNDIINSSGFVIKMYLNFLEKVVPANISYFHFMREKDLYIHLTALRYCLKAGNINKSYLRRVHLFSSLSQELKSKIFKLVGHWLYDMVKYYCSVIFIESDTLPHLINIQAAVICGLLENRRHNIFDQFEESERKEIYERTLYSFTHLLCKANQQNNFEKLQIILIGLTRLFRSMNEEASMITLCGYAPSYWYVSQLGFVKEPFLQKICVLIVADILTKKDRKFSHPDSDSSNANNNKNKEKNAKKSKGKRRNKIGSYEKFQDQQYIEEESTNNNLPFVSSVEDSEKLQHDNNNNDNNKKNNNNFRINDLTCLEAYNLLLVFSSYLPKYGQEEKFQQMLVLETERVDKESIFRPFLTQVIRTMMQAAGKLELSDVFMTRPGWQEIIKSNKKHFVPEELQVYLGKSQDYEIDGVKTSLQEIGDRIRLFLNQTYPQIVQNYESELIKSETTIWNEILKEGKKYSKMIIDRE